MENNNNNTGPETLYKNELVLPDNVTIPFYTEQKEDWIKIEKEVLALALSKIVQWFLIGIVLGLFFGYGIANAASPEQVKNEIIKLAPNKEVASDLLAIAFIESSFKPNAIGAAQEYGLYQFHPAVFKLDEKDKTVQGQIKFAIEHIKWLTAYCPGVKLAIAWNVGCTGAKKLKEPTKFGYYLKFKKEKAKYAKEIKTIEQNSRSAASNKLQAVNSKNTDKKI